MRKAILTGFAVLLALALFSCNAPITTSNAEMEFTADGRPLIELTIGASTSRALTDTLARGGIDFYEVAFFDADLSQVYRTAWNRGRSGRIRLPPGRYGLNAARAIMFAGNSRDNTLLAVGLLTHIGDREGLETVTAATGNDTAVIQVSTTDLRFTLLPLLTDVHASGASTFQTVDAGTSTNYYKETAAYTEDNFPHLRALGVDRTTPLFLLPKARGEPSLGTMARFTLAITAVDDDLELEEDDVIATSLGGGFSYTVPADYTIDEGDTYNIILTANAVGVVSDGDITLIQGITASNITGITFGTSTAAYVADSFVNGTAASAGGNPVNVTYAIGLPEVPIPGVTPAANFRFAPNFGPGIFLADNGFVDQTIVLGTGMPVSDTVRVLITEPSKPDPDAVPPITTNVTFAQLANATSPADTTASLIKMEIRTKDADYYTKIYFEIPINAISSETGVGGTLPGRWYIRGGLENDMFDEGAKVNSLGGAIVLGIGAVQFITIDGVIHEGGPSGP